MMEHRVEYTKTKAFRPLLPVQYIAQISIRLINLIYPAQPRQFIMGRIQITVTNAYNELASNRIIQASARDQLDVVLISLRYSLGNYDN